MRVSIPEFKTKSELHAYLVKNVKELSEQKKSLPIKSDNCGFGCKSVGFPEKTFKTKSKVLGEKAVEEKNIMEEEIVVKAIANVMGWCDSHRDVLIKDCAKKTIKDKGASNQRLFYHLKDHKHSSEGIIGRQAQASLEDIALNQFNVDSSIKESQAIIGQSIVAKRYDEKAFYLYSDDEIKQHSIGLQYVRLYLCVDSDDPDYTQYKENWDKYISEVINKETVERLGYFWAVTEIRLLEFSAVLFGSNELTPTEETSKASGEPPVKGTPGEETEEPSAEDTLKESRKRLLLI